MGRGIRKWTEKDISRLQAEGRGQGKGPTYSPWVHVGDFFSSGRTHKAYSHKTRRVHHFLSDGEWRAFLLFEWAHDVRDVREGFPLPRDITMEIAMALGIKHQYFPGTHVPFVMSLDFLVTRNAHGKERHQAFNVKCLDDLEDARTVEILEIARETCMALDIDHHLIVSEHLPRTKLKNLEWIRDAQLDEDTTEPYPGFYEEHMTKMTQDIRSRRFDGSLVEYCGQYDERYSVEAGVGLRVARMLLTSRVLRMDLNNPDPQLAHMDTFQLTAQPGRLRSVGGA